MVSGPPNYLANLEHMTLTLVLIFESQFLIVHPSKDEKYTKLSCVSISLKKFFHGFDMNLTFQSNTIVRGNPCYPTTLSIHSFIIGIYRHDHPYQHENHTFGKSVDNYLNFIMILLCSCHSILQNRMLYYPTSTWKYHVAATLLLALDVRTSPDKSTFPDGVLHIILHVFR